MGGFQCTQDVPFPYVARRQEGPICGRPSDSVSFDAESSDSEIGLVSGRVSIRASISVSSDASVRTFSWDSKSRDASIYGGKGCLSHCKYKNHRNV